MTRLTFKLSREERKHYLLALLSMAGADGEVSEEEKRFLRERSAELKCRLKSWDFKQFNITKIRDGIHSVEARRALLKDLTQLADADGRDGTEQRILQSLARVWKLPLPGLPAAMPGELSPDEEALLRDFSSSRRERFAADKELQDIVLQPPSWGAILFMLPHSLFGFVLFYFTFIGDTSWTIPEARSPYTPATMLRILRGVAILFSLVGLLNIHAAYRALTHRSR